MNKSIYSKEHKKIIEKLVLARKEKEYDQAKVAKLLGKSQSYISKIEAGQRRLDIVQLKEIAKIYGLSISNLLK